MQQYFLQLGRGDAVVECAAHMAFEFVLFAHGNQHGHGDHAAVFQIQPGALPDVASGFGSDVFLHGLREVCGAAQGFVHKIFAHDLSACGQAFVEMGVV
jgi:hypothetical protein